MFPAVLGLAFFALGRPEDVRWWIILFILVGAWTSAFLNLWGQRRYTIGHVWAQSRQLPYPRHVNQAVHRENNMSDSDSDSGTSSESSDSDADLDIGASDNEPSIDHVGKVEKARQIVVQRCISVLISVLMLVLIVLVDYKLLDLKRTTDAWLTQPGVSDELGIVWTKLYSLSPGISKAIAIAVFGRVFSSVAEKLVEFESHADDQTQRIQSC